MKRPMPERRDRVLEFSILVFSRCGRDIGSAAAAQYVFGYTCMNDIAAVELLKTDPSFRIGTRSKCYI
jgi:2-keto-4-pentenoate hydratase/2-oxohepta-3-ene-1,7-dioic acid hydratase in catechol pathway